MVLMGREDPSRQVSAILTDNQLVGQRAAQQFLVQKQKQLGYIAGRRDGQATLERQRGFTEALRAKGKEISGIIYNADYKLSSWVQFRPESVGRASGDRWHFLRL